jgi:hypothetical protein
MATSPSLFGGSMSPQEMQAQLLNQRATQFAQLTPDQQLGSMAYRAGAGIGTGLAGAFGVNVQDPMIQRATRLRELAGQYNTNTAAGLRQMADALRTQDPDMALQLSQRAAAMDLEASKIQAEQALAAQRSREKAAADPFQKLVEGGKYTTESLKKYQESGNVADLVLAKPEAGRKTSTVTAGGRKLLIDDLTGETIKDLGAAGKTLEESLGAGLGTLGKALLKGRESEAKEEGGFAAKDFNTLGSSVAAGTASKRNIVVLENAMKNAFTGKFADVKEGVVTGLEGLGIKVGDDLRRAASNTQLINAMGTRYVFPLVKNFPGSLAAKELERLEKTAPNALQQPETIETLMNLLKQDLAENEYTYNKAKQYKEANKGSTIGFNPADAKIEFQNKLTDLRNRVQSVRRAGRMTAAERDQINALKKELGVD